MDTLVQWAVRLSSVEMLKNLIETGGANVNGSYGPNEDTLLHIAVKTLWTSGCVTLSCIKHQPTVIRLLLRSGARVDALNRSGASALHLLCLHLSDRGPGTSCRQVPGMKILDLLLEAGANVNLPSRKPVHRHYTAHSCTDPNHRWTVSRSCCLLAQTRLRKCTCRRKASLVDLRSKGLLQRCTPGGKK